MAKKHTIVLDIVGLEYKDIVDGKLPNIARLAEHGQIARMEPVFPAVTCTVQASILSGKLPSQHGIISNGLYDRDTYTVSFWEQASKLVQSPRIWDVAKSRDPSFTTAVLFWQNSMYAQSDVVVTPRPLHTDDGMILWCYSKPLGYYDDELKQRLGEFNLAQYWGPLASAQVSDWICSSVEYTFERFRPDLMLAYIPHVDYSAQRFGKDSSQVQADLKKADDIVGRIVEKTAGLGIRDDAEFVVFSEYSFNNVRGEAVPLNLLLRDAGLAVTRTIAGKEYLDFELSTAFAMVDHQIAHIYVKGGEEGRVRKILEDADGVETVLQSAEEKSAAGINHSRSGELIAISEVDRWFSYYWWHDPEKAPGFSRRVDIHRKPGYDPVELFFDPRSKSIPLDTTLVKGSHGRKANVETGEGLSAFVSSRKSGSGDKIVKCTDVAGAILG